MTRADLNRAFVTFREQTIVNSIIGRAGTEVVNHLQGGLDRLESQLADDLGLTWDDPQPADDATATRSHQVINRPHTPAVPLDDKE